MPSARCRSWPSSRRCSGPRVRHASTGCRGNGFRVPPPCAASPCRTPPAGSSPCAARDTSPCGGCPTAPSAARVSAGARRSRRNGPCSGSASARTGPAILAVPSGPAWLRSMISRRASGAPSGSSSTSMPASGGTAFPGTSRVTAKRERRAVGEAAVACHGSGVGIAHETVERRERARRAAVPGPQAGTRPAAYAGKPIRSPGSPAASTVIRVSSGHGHAGTARCSPFMIVGSRRPPGPSIMVAHQCGAAIARVSQSTTLREVAAAGQQA